MNVFLILIVCASLCYQACMDAIVIGSETAVSVISTPPTFPAADTDNMMLGFGWFQGGFTLQDSTTSCTFNGVYPVSGTVNMNGGTLYLAQDLVLSNITDLQGLGRIIGNGHSVTFCADIDELPSDLSLIKDLTVIFNQHTELTSSVTVQGICRVVSNGSKLDMEAGAGFVVDTDSAITLQNMFIEGVGNDNVSCIDDTGRIIFNNVLLCLTGDTRFRYGSLTWQGTNEITSAHTFWYDSIMPCFIDDESQLHLSGGLTFKIGKKSATDAEPMQFYDKLSTIICDTCTINITGSGVQLKRGAIELNKLVTFDVDATDTNFGLILGNGTDIDQDITMFQGPGNRTVFNTGAFVYNNVNAQRFSVASPSCTFMRKIDSTFHMATTCTFPQNTIEYEFDGIHFPPTTLGSGVKLYYDNTRIIISSIGDGTIHAQRGDGYSFALNSFDSIYITNGIFGGGIKVVGSSNRIGGIGAVSGPISFQNSSSSVTLALSGYLLDTIDLKGGTLTLANDINVVKSDCFTSSGTMNIATYAFTYNYLGDQPDQVQELTAPIRWVSNGGRISFTDNTTLSTTWTIAGTCTLDGNWNILTFGAEGKIVVESGAKLTMRNVDLSSLSTDKLICVDNTSKIILENVNWIQEGDFNFTTGLLSCQGSVVMSGRGTTFSFQSTQPLTIEDNASLEMDYHFTFSYAPSNASQTLLSFGNQQSKLILSHATLYAYPGLQMTKGQLCVQLSPTIYAPDGGTFGEGGLTLGNSTTGYDTELVFLDVSTLTIAQGALNYKNVGTNSILSLQNCWLSINSGASLVLFEDLIFEQGTVLFGENCTFAYKSGKILSSGIESINNHNTIEF